MHSEPLQQTMKQLRKQHPIAVSDELLVAMLTNIGTLDANLRDRLIYSSFANWLGNNIISDNQAKWLTAQVIQNNLLFKCIHEPQNDAIYTRTFTALLLTSLVDRDARTPFMSERVRAQVFEDATRYLQLENDLRGNTVHGWAHAFGHGGDLLFYVCYHPKFPKRLVSNVLLSLYHGIMLPDGFTAGEGSRLDNCLIALQSQDRMSESQLLHWLMAVQENISLTEAPGLRFDQGQKFMSLCVSLAYKLRFEKLSDGKVVQWLEEQIGNFYEQHGTVF